MTLSQALHARYQNAVLGPKPAAVSSTVNLEVNAFEKVISASVLEVYDTPGPYDYERFKRLRSHLSNALDTAKSKFISQKIYMATSAKQRWSTLRFQQRNSLNIFLPS